MVLRDDTPRPGVLLGDAPEGAGSPWLLDEEPSNNSADAAAIHRQPGEKTWKH